MKKTVKAYYRRSKAHAARNDFDSAVKDLEAAVKLDPSDPNDIQQELVQLRNKGKEYDKKQTQKMQGFLLKGDQQ